MTRLLPGRNCVFATDWSVVGSRCRGGRAEYVRVRAQDSDSEIVRRAKTKVPPVYPDLARKMNITGRGKGTGGGGAEWNGEGRKSCGWASGAGKRGAGGSEEVALEPAAVESTGVVDFKFEPHQ